MNQAPLKNDEGKRMAENISAVTYLECSAKTKEGVREVFEQVWRGSCWRCGVAWFLREVWCGVAWFLRDWWCMIGAHVVYGCNISGVVPAGLVVNDWSMCGVWLEH